MRKQNAIRSAAGFFFFFGFAALGSATAPGARSIDVSRPAVKV